MFLKTMLVSFLAFNFPPLTSQKVKNKKAHLFFFFIEVQLERQKCQIKIPFDSFWSILNRKLLLTMKVYSSLSTYEIIANVNTISGSID